MTHQGKPPAETDEAWEDLKRSHPDMHVVQVNQLDDQTIRVTYPMAAVLDIVKVHTERQARERGEPVRVNEQKIVAGGSALEQHSTLLPRTKPFQPVNPTVALLFFTAGMFFWEVLRRMVTTL